MEEDFTRIWSYADANQNKFIEELKEIVTQPSISAQDLGLKECAEIIRRKMSALGIKTRLINVPDAPDVIFGELESNEKTANTLVIYNHYDVQPVEPLSEWKSDPFKPEIRENKLYGRGVGDDKGEIAARLCAIKSIIDTGSSIRPNIRWIIEGEEETGSVHFHKFVIKNHSLLKGDGCLWEGGDRSTSGTPEVHLGVKGLLYVEYRLKVGRKDQHSMYGPIAPNPAWRLINLLTTIRNDKGRIQIDGFYDRVAKPTAQEKEFLKNNEFDSKELKRALEIDYLLEEKNDLETVTKLLYAPTANIAGFGSGYLGEGSKTIVPKDAFAKMDFRLVANMKATDILARLRRHIKSHGYDDVELIVHSKEDPAKTPVESKIAGALIKCAELVYKKKPNVWPTIAGTGPLSVFTDKLKLQTAMGAGVSYPGSGFHAPNEHILLDHYNKAIKQLVCLLRIF